MNWQVACIVTATPPKNPTILQECSLMNPFSQFFFLREKAKKIRCHIKVCTNIKGIFKTTHISLTTFITSWKYFQIRRWKMPETMHSGAPSSAFCENAHKLLMLPSKLCPTLFNLNYLYTILFIYKLLFLSLYSNQMPKVVHRKPVQAPCVALHVSMQKLLYKFEFFKD